MKEIYDWVPWFRELAETIAQGGEKDLIDKAKAVDWGPGKRALLDFDNKGIDPFSFFYFLASKNTSIQRRKVYLSVHNQFHISSTLPDGEDAYIFPTPPPMAQVLFHDGKNFDHDLLWSLFKQVVVDNRNINPNDFKKVLDIKNVAVTKLTQTLFLINPEYFLPVDDATGVVSEALLDLSSRELERKIKENGLQEYLSVVEKLKKAFPECQPYEIALFLYLQSKLEVKVSGKFFHVSSKAHGYKEDDHWEQFKKNNWVYTGGPESGTSWDDWSDNSKRGKYPLDDPKPGDGILVRTGTKKGRAIGIVYKNDYADPHGFNGKSKIHVLWINKSENPLSKKENTEWVGFNKTEKGSSTYSAFEKTEGYKSSFDLIERLAPNHEPKTPDNQQSKADAMKHPLNQILCGPPGTGKTWNTVNYAVAIAEERSVENERDEDVKARFDNLKKQGRIAMVTFHQNFTYEDFIEGIRPVLNDESESVRYELTKGIFREIAERASKNGKENYVLIIDEINRGNIAKIFGELITLIEPSKRLGRDDEATVILPYSQESFGVPANLYVVGTMNTADRSIALLDTALRRRFEFVEMMPNSSHSGISKDIEGVNCQDLLAAMNKRICFLLNRERQIGHTYFMDVQDMASLATTFRTKIIPLLQEYFYDDWKKIDLVLNGNGFIREIPVEDGLFKDSDLVDREKKIYELLPGNDRAWQRPETYQIIY